MIFNSNLNSFTLDGQGLKTVISQVIKTPQMKYKSLMYTTGDQWIAMVKTAYYC